MCFVLIKGESKCAEQNKTLQPEFYEKVSSEICTIFDIGCCSKLAFER